MPRWNSGSSWRKFQRRRFLFLVWIAPDRESDKEWRIGFKLISTWCIWLSSYLWNFCVNVSWITYHHCLLIDVSHKRRSRNIFQPWRFTKSWIVSPHHPSCHIQHTTPTPNKSQAYACTFNVSPNLVVANKLTPKMPQDFCPMFPINLKNPEGVSFGLRWKLQTFNVFPR